MTLAIRALALSILALAGCGGTQATEPAPAGDQGTSPGAPADAGPAPAATDAAAPDAAAQAGPEAGPAACDLTGTWQGTLPGGHFRGQAVTWVIAPGGATESTFGPAHVRSTTTLSGAEVSIVDHEATPAIVACPADPPGRYAVAFGQACATATLTLTDDPCSGRRDSLAGITLTRQ